MNRTGKRTWKGSLSDLEKSAIRYVKNNFKDGPIQDAMDLFYGKYKVNERTSHLFYKPWYTRIETYIVWLMIGIILVTYMSYGSMGFYLGMIWIIIGVKQLLTYRYRVVSYPVLIREMDYSREQGQGGVLYDQGACHIDTI